MLIKIYILIFYAAIIAFGTALNVNPKRVKTGDVARTFPTSSITNCYYTCWDLVLECCAVGFLTTEINKKDKQEIICHLIRCKSNPENQEFLQLDVIVRNFHTFNN